MLFRVFLLTIVTGQLLLHEMLKRGIGGSFRANMIELCDATISIEIALKFCTKTDDKNKGSTPITFLARGGSLPCGKVPEFCW
jgi:hypothetical protein